MFIVCAMYQKSQEHAHKQLPHMSFWTHTNFCNLYHQTLYYFDYHKNTFGHFCRLWDDQIDLSTYCFHLTWLWFTRTMCIQYALSCIQPVNSVMLQESNLYDYFLRRIIYYGSMADQVFQWSKLLKMCGSNSSRGVQVECVVVHSVCHYCTKVQF